MSKLKNKIKKIEEVNNAKNQNEFAIIRPFRSETKDEAIKRHIKENPADRNAKIKIIDVSVWW